MFKQDFSLLSTTKTVYLDSAASTQKPTVVLDAMDDFYRMSYANIHRGQCRIATQATERYESARQTVADFIGTNPQQIIFTKGTTESINLVASGYAKMLKPTDEILVSVAEHHANFVPWQQACLESGATFKTVNVLPDGTIDWADFRAKLSSKTKLVAVAQVGNVLGIENPIKALTKEAHAVGACLFVDGAQSIAHIPVNVTELDCDFFAFSGHKIYGPTGIGVLYGKTEALESLPPYQFGGDMIQAVTPEKTTFAPIPARFEAGTPPFVEAIGLATALRYVNDIGFDTITAHETELTNYLWNELNTISHFEPLGTSPDKKGIIAFNIKGIHPADIAFGLSQDNICVRVGHHCAMPIHAFWGKEVSLRVSLGIYNTKEDIDTFIKSLRKVLSLLGEG